MDFIKMLGAASLIALLAGCSSPQDKAAQAQESSYEAQEKVAKERLNLPADGNRALILTYKV